MHETDAIITHFYKQEVVRGLEGWDSGREAQKEGAICIHIVDTCCRRAETNTTL